MSMFKALLAADLDTVFFNPNEFAEEVLINKEPKLVIFDEELLTKQNLKLGEGVTRGERLFIIRKIDMPVPPGINKRLKLNQTDYRVLDLSESEDTYTITLVRH